MRTRLTIACTLTALLAATGVRADNAAALAALATKLHQARALPAGTQTHLLCPTHLQDFVGIAGSTLAASLGEADYVVDGRDENPPQPQAKWSYFLKNHTSAGAFPVLTFYLGQTSKVEQVECSVSK